MSQQKCRTNNKGQTMPLMGTFLSCMALMAIAYQFNTAEAAAVMSVDLGTEAMKVGVVSPGVPMEIALNRESKRKTPAILAFRDSVRTFGEDAQTVGIREPSAAYGYLLDLLGKTIDNPIVDLYRKRFPYYDIVGDPVRNTVIFKKSDTEQFSVEELIAQILQKAREFAQDSTQQPVSECVLTVPGYFGQAEREALMTAASLANLKVLQLINDYTAVALNYGVFHRNEINETAQYFVFYDMGAYKTSAAVVSYQLVKDPKTKEINPVVQVLGVGFDRTLGGLDIQLRLRDYLASQFNALKKTKTDVTKSPRALAKLFKEAGRLKNVLSANNDHYAQIENLIDDQDLKLQVTREQLEELCKDLWPRVTKPFDQALKSSGLTLEAITQVIIFGGGTRVPKVQEILKEHIKQELGKSLNADEAAAMGAVYKAADLATGFKVKKFVVKDAVIYPIQISFERDPGDGTAVKQVKRQLFGAMNSYPQKKVITFNKHTDDFDFYVYYGDFEHLTEQDVAYLGSLNISRVELQKVKDILGKNQEKIVDSKGIKAYFYLDDSGIFKCTGVDFVYEKQKEDESTLSKLGSTISKLFAKDKEGDGADKNQEGSGEDKASKDGSDEENKADKPESESSSQNKTSDDSSKNDGENAANKTIKLVTVKEPMEHRITFQFTPTLNDNAYDESFKRLASINKAEADRNRLESTFNALESHVVEIQQKLEEEEYASCATKEEKEKILSECSAISEWLYDDIEKPTPDIYEKRLKELRKLTDVFMSRHWEHEERPDALKALANLIDHSKKFLNTAKNLTKDANPEKDVFTQVEIDTLSKLIDETVEWKETETAAQNKLQRNEDVRLTIKDITEKMSALDREVKYLLNKLKVWQPKVKPTKAKKEEKAASSDNKTDEAQRESAKQEEEEQVEEPQTERKEQADQSTQTPEPSKTEDATPRSEL